MSGVLHAGVSRRTVLRGMSQAAAGAVLLLLTVAPRIVGAQDRREPSAAPATGERMWGDSIARAQVAQAIERRGIQLADSTLVDYTATARGFLAFLAQLGEDFSDPPRVVQSEELALRVSWWQPGRSAQQLVGRRDTTLLPANVGYYRDRYGVVLDNLPDRIKLGDGFDVADVPHPLAPGADSLYEYQRGDSFSMRLPDREILVEEVNFRPRNVNAPRAVGSVYLDRATSAVVRLQLTFTRAAILDRRIETLVITLENSLVRGRYWLPRRQEVEVVRRSTWLDVPARGIVRGHWEVSQYTINEGVRLATTFLPTWSSVSRDSLKRYVFEGEVVDMLPPDMRVARDADVRDAQQRAEAAVRAAALARPMTFAAAGRGVSDVIRHSRTEGLALGFGVAHRWPQSITLSARARYGIDDGAVKGRISLDKRPPLGGAPVVELFGERLYRELGVPERSGVVNSVASLFLGSDYTTPVDVRAAGLQWRLGALRRWSLRAAYETESALQVAARPVSGTYAPVLNAWSTKGVRVDLVRIGRFGAPEERRGAWTLRAIGSAANTTDDRAISTAANATNDRALAVRAQALRLEGDVSVEWPLSRGRTLIASATGGTTMGRNIPPQWLQFAGGSWSGPGYEFHSFVGRAMASTRLEWRTPVPFPSVPLGKYGKSPARAQLAPFVQAVVLRGASADRNVSRFGDGVYPTVGLGALFFYDLLRVDVSRGLNRGTWRFAIDVDRAFWGVL